MSLYATSFTRTGQVDMTDNRRLNPRKANRANTSKPPRTRDGAKYPGGRQMRRALASLAARRAAFTPAASRTLPGSLNNG